MPNANESTSPPEGGNVKDAYGITTQTNPHGVTKALLALTSNNHTNSDKELTSTCSSEDKSQQDRTRVIKELGITSTSFIGPACRPEPPSIEQELSEFYKELEKVDHSDRVDDKQSRHQSNIDPSIKDIPVVVTDHSRAYRPYPDPRERSGQQWEGPKRWRPRMQYGDEGFAQRRHLGPWYPPPPWIPRGPPNQDFQYVPPPPFRPHIRPHLNFHSHADISNTAPWEGSWLPANEWHDNGRGPSFGDSRYTGDYETFASNWQQHKPGQQFHYKNTFHLILLRGLPGSGKSTLAR